MAQICPFVSIGTMCFSVASESTGDVHLFSSMSSALAVGWDWNRLISPMTGIIGKRPGHAPTSTNYGLCGRIRKSQRTIARVMIGMLKWKLKWNKLQQPVWTLRWCVKCLDVFISWTETTRAVFKTLKLHSFLGTGAAFRSRSSENRMVHKW